MRRCESFFQAFHPGLDIANAEYTPIHAAAAGLVVWAGLAVPGDDHGSYGNCVIIKHNAHISMLYAHMDDQIHPLEVRVGDRGAAEAGHRLRGHDWVGPPARTCTSRCRPSTFQ